MVITLLVLWLLLAVAFFRVMYQYDEERIRRRKAEKAAGVAEAARLDALEALGLAGEARRTQAASHAAEVERLTAAHGETAEALARANERTESVTAELATARQWNATAARTHDVEVAGFKADLAAARRTIDQLEDFKSTVTELARGIVTESEK